jgi:membrane protein YqaA with SNARE-associated domain
MLRKIYNWVMDLADHRHAERGLAIVSFLESSVFPIPPDALLIPMGLANRARVFRYALIMTIASVLGGLAGYLIGWLLYDTVGQAILSFYGMEEKFSTFVSWYHEYGTLIVLFAGITPFPYKVITIASGVAGLDLVIFTISSIIARALRFYLVAGLLYWFGPTARDILENHLGKVTLAFGLLVIGGFVLVRYLF